MTSLIAKILQNIITRLFHPKSPQANIASNPKPHTPNPKPQTSNLKPQTSNLKPQTPNLKPQTPNPKPQTPNPKPQTHRTMTRIPIHSLLVILFLLAAGNLTAREYHITSLDITAELASDGSMQVLEEREFSFEGSFSEVFRTFPLDGQASFADFQVSVDGVEYPITDTQEPGTAMLDPQDDYQELRIFVDAEDTSKVFGISFRVTGALERYEDAALLYYQLISAEWAVPTGNIRARIIPPEPLEEDQPRHWVHGSLEAVSSRLDGGEVTLSLDHLPAEHFLEIRALYPQAVFSEMPQTPGDIEDEVLEEVALLVEEANRMREEALQRAQEEAERAERQAERHQRGRQLAIPLALLVVVWWTWHFRKYRNKPVLQEKPGAFSGLPDKERPALVNYLLNGTFVNSHALISTIFDLAHRGIITIRESEKKEKPVFGKPKPRLYFVLNKDAQEKMGGDLLPYEKKLLRFLFEDLAETPGEVSLSRLKKKQTRTHKFFASWTKTVKREGKRKDWFDKRSIQGQQLGILIGALLMIGFLMLAVFLYGPWFLIPAGTSLLALMGSIAIAHRTEAGEKAYQQWKYLRNFLKKYDFESDMREMDAFTVNAYLVYGMAMGLGPKYFKRLTRGIETHGHHGYLYWIILHQHGLSSFSDTINQVITTTSTTMSSASGMGGGGTAGGGGGAASGGGGAR